MLEQPVGVQIGSSSNDEVFVTILAAVDSFDRGRSWGTLTASWHWTRWPSSCQALDSLEKIDALDALDEADDIPALIAAVTDPAARGVHVKVRASTVLMERAPANLRCARSAQFDAVAGDHVGGAVLLAKGVRATRRPDGPALIFLVISGGSNGVDALYKVWRQ